MSIIQVASRIQTVKEYYFSKKLKEIARLRQAGQDIINLGIGSPDLPPAQNVIDRLSSEAQNKAHHAYQGYVGIPELRQAFAKWYQQYFHVALDPNTEILPLIGSKEGIMHISMTYLEPGDEVLVPNPGYPAYQATANLSGATTRSYHLEPSKGWLPDLDALAKEDLTKVKIMWVNYPNMPTGANADRTFYTNLVAFAKKHQILICNDNPYAFILNDKPFSLLSIEGAKEVALELNSLSKAHNMAGWRVGMLAGKPEYLNEIMKFKSNMDSGMFRPVQLAAAEALSQAPTWYEGLNQIYGTRREKVYELLDLLDCTFERGQTGMFVWAKIPKQYADGYAMSDKILYNTQVFITPGGIFGTQGNAYIRVSLCAKVEVFEAAMERIKNKL